MPQRTKIEWTDYTSNPIVPKEGGWGCSKVSPGCDYCYAEVLNKRFGNRRAFQGKWEFRLNWQELNRWDNIPAGSRLFVGDMTDLFHSNVEWDDLIDLFEAMADRRDLTFQVLTKRPGRMAYFANEILHSWGMRWPPNVWAGISVETQKYAPRFSCLAQIPARVRFVSAEPLLGPLDLHTYLDELDWVICGGESGPDARPMDIAWARDLRDQCQAAGVPFFMKQLGTRQGLRDRKGGDPAEWPEDLRVREMPNV